ncbi:uncharacterized protein LOC117168495 [Belonocnema kinseyi]|uniref:uncharacterized protein LOC117168495 n=1 Tax=Belonocnema kinseyi TaxID=2817044 RepID=UPI00143D4210|nr:uncharacterized protein LOC117168495 [Belonocnema kinseyi]XP_033210090.1 uncharacterized protein LOC117168495 [Belonocnema kinseyi]
MNGREEIILGLNWKTEKDGENDKYKSSGQQCRGFHLTRSKWDPYPWVGLVENGSDAEMSGLRPGDCLLEVDGADVLGLKMPDIASLIGKNNRISLQVWRRRATPEKKSEDNEEVISSDKKEKNNVGVLALEGPLPEVALKLTSAVSGVVRALECPICLETAASPVSQCVNGHILCVGCRAKSTRCPVCRVCLGQGRCLLADVCHKVLVESFGFDNTASNENEYSLRERLFGSQKPSQKPQRISEKHRLPPRSKNLISRIFPSIGFNEKAASTESLPATSYSDENTASTAQRWLLPRRSDEERLNLNDRTKSASTGELSREADRTVSGSLHRLTTNGETHSSNGLLSVPQTPLWGGSTESITSCRLKCPLWKKKGCKELLTAGSILEHLNGSHPGPTIHFHRGKVTLPVPCPFSSEGIYVLHHGGDLFFLQIEEEAIWIAATGVSGNKWGWILSARDDHGTEVTFRKDVISLQEFNNSSPLLNAVELSKNLCVQTIEISLLEFGLDEGIEL